MKQIERFISALLIAAGLWLGSSAALFAHVVDADPNESPKLRNPVHIAIAPDGRRAVVVCHNNSIAVINLESGNYETQNINASVWPGEHPLKAVFVGNSCFVINEYSEFITEFDPATLAIKANHAVPMYCQDLLYDEVLQRFYVSNKWLDEVLLFDKNFNAVPPNIRVGRNPGPMALSTDRKFLYVGNAGSWNISVVDLGNKTVTKSIYLGSAPTALAATAQHIIATTHGGRNLDKINDAPLIKNDQADIINVVTYIDQNSGSLSDYFLDQGADYSDLRIQSGLMVFTGAATGSAHLYRLSQAPSTMQTIDVLDDEWNLPGGRAASGLRIYANTRTAAIKDGNTVYCANYFRDTVVEIKFDAIQNRFVVTREIPLNDLGVALTAFQSGRVNLNRRQNGERYFNTIAGWKRGQTNFTCGTCHVNGHTDFRFIYDTKSDPFNPGVEQGPEKHPSSIAANLTSPFGWEGNQQTLSEFNNAALNAHDVQNGSNSIHEDVSAFLVNFEELLRPEPNPFSDSKVIPPDVAAIRRGKTLFTQAGCARCHAGAAFTDRTVYNVGTGRTLDTPTLLQLWDKAPYLHDGRASTILDVLEPSKYDRINAHGNLSGLSTAQKNDLAAYLLALPASNITDVEEQETAVPSDFVLAQNYPNPFSRNEAKQTSIAYQLSKPGKVELVIYDMLGKAVRALIEQQLQPAGAYRVLWNGANESGAQVPSGIYLYRLKTASFEQTRKLILIQ